MMPSRKRSLGACAVAVLLAFFFITSQPVLAQAGTSRTLTDAEVQHAIEVTDEDAQKQLAAGNGVGIAIAVVHNDKVVFSKGYGLREAGKDARVDPETVFQLASISKPVGATVLASLFGDGKVTWDSKLSDLDPGFQMYHPWVTNQITIRDMYCHRSGLPDHAGDLLEDMGYNREQVLHRLRYQKPDTSFRSGYAYTNFGITEAAVAAAKANGMSWEDASDTRLYKPAGMTSSSSRYCDFVARSDRALGHVKINGKWVQQFNRQPDAQSPAGGVSSNIVDMARWMRLQLADGNLDGKQIIAEKPLLATRVPQMHTTVNPFDGLPGFYGLAMNVNYDDHGVLRLSHSGAFDLGASTCVTMIPAAKLGIVVLTNTHPIGVAEGLANSFIDIAMNGKATQDWFGLFAKVFAAMDNPDQKYNYSKLPESPAPALPNSAYVGTYNNKLYGDVVIFEKNGTLAMIQGPIKLEFAITHFDRDTFTYETVGENACGKSGIRFTLAPDGKASAVTIDNLDTVNQGTFKRQ